MGCAQSHPATVHSRPEPGVDDSLDVVAPDLPKSAPSTRARRLSWDPNGVHATPAGDGERAAHPTPAGNGTAQATAAPAEPQPGEQAASRAGSLQQQGSGELGVASLELMKRNSGTRSRRLSYLTNDAGLAEKLAAEAQLGEQAAALDASAEAEAGMAAADAAAASRPAAAAAAGCDKGTGPRAPPARAVEVVAASMSRVGVEPGYKKTNQDACFVYSSYISEHCSLFGAFDGHGPNGHLVSAFVKHHLPVVLMEDLTSGIAPGDALSRGFLAVDERLGASAIDCEFSGSTAVVAFLKGNELTTAWVGDSRAVLGRATPCGRSVAAVGLTEDHKPAAPGERERILRNQGRVERLVDEEGQPMGPYRVWLSYAWVPGLAMSRALGDHLAHTVGVTSEPEHVSVTLCADDRFLVLASDGVWEFISSQEAVDMVAAAGSVEDACRALVDEAHQRWLVEEEGVVDDITAVVVKLQHGAPSARDGASSVAAAATITARREVAMP